MLASKCKALDPQCLGATFIRDIAVLRITSGARSLLGWSPPTESVAMETRAVSWRRRRQRGPRQASAFGMRLSHFRDSPSEVCSTEQSCSYGLQGNQRHRSLNSKYRRDTFMPQFLEYLTCCAYLPTLPSVSEGGQGHACHFGFSGWIYGAEGGAAGLGTLPRTGADDAATQNDQPLPAILIPYWNPFLLSSLWHGDL